jgi:hypothetical protein
MASRPVAALAREGVATPNGGSNLYAVPTLLGRPKLEKLTTSALAEMEEENGETASVGFCMLVCEVRTDEGETAFYTFATDKREWIQRAAIEEARVAMEFSEVEVDGD